ncbi:MAG: MarR family transcriptional regulator [Shewanella sp.]
MADAKQLLAYLCVELMNKLALLEENALRQQGIVDLTLREVHVIEAISVQHHQQMNVVAQRLNISLGTLSVVVKRLIDKNYIVRRRDQRDRRIFRLDLTLAGEEVNAIHQHFHQTMIDELERDLLHDGQADVQQFLTQLVAYFETYSRQQKGGIG